MRSTYFLSRRSPVAPNITTWSWWCRLGILLTLAIAALNGCGGGDATDPFARARFSDARRTILSGTEVKQFDIDPIDLATQLFNFAESNFSQYFSGTAETAYFAPYIYRYYAQTGVYLGIADGGIYVMGGQFGNSPLYVGALTDFFVPINTKSTASSVRGDIRHSPVIGARVYWDCDINWQLDSDEISTAPNSDGSYVIQARPNPGCQLRARIPPQSSTSSASLAAVGYTLSAAPGQTTHISPLTTLIALTGLTVSDLQATLPLPSGSIQAISLLSDSDRAEVNRMASVVIVQLQEGDKELQGVGRSAVGAAIIASASSLARPMILGRIAPMLAPGDGAEIFWDTNNNWKRDEWEVSSIANDRGEYLIRNSPQKDAVLRATAAWGARDSSGLTLPPFTMSAQPNRPEAIDPFTTLLHLTGLSASQLEVALGVAPGTVNGNATSADAIALAEVISVQLANRMAEISTDGGRGAGDAILHFTRRILAGEDFSSSEATMDVTKAGRAGISSASSEVLRRRSALTGITDQARLDAVRSAKSTPAPEGATAAAGDRLLSVVGYVNNVPPSEPIKHAAVDSVIYQLTKAGVDIGRRGVLADFDQLNWTLLDSLLKQMTAGGVVQDSVELDINSALQSKWNQVDSGFDAATRAELYKYGTGLLKDYFGSLDTWLNLTEGLIGVVSFASDVPDPGFLDMIKKSKKFKGKKGEIAFVLLVVKTALGTANCVDKARGLAISPSQTGEELSEEEGERLSGALTTLVDCSFKMVGKKATVKKLYETVFKDFTALSKIAIEYKISGLDGSDLALAVAFSEGGAVVVDYFGQFAKTGKVQGGLKILASVFRSYAIGAKIRQARGADMDKAIAALEVEHERMWREVREIYYVLKLKQRLSRVLSPIFSQPSWVVSTKCSIFADRIVDCFLSSGSAATTSQGASRVSAGRSHRLGVTNLGQADLGIASVLVEYGDGWTSDTDPESSGRQLTGNESIRHSYLTYGRYRVTTTAKSTSGEEYRDSIDLDVVRPTTDEESPVPEIQQVDLRQIPEGGIYASLLANTSGADLVRDVKVILTPLLSSGNVGQSCVLQLSSISVPAPGGSFAASGCPGVTSAGVRAVLGEISAASANGQRVTKKAVTIALSGTGAKPVVTGHLPSSAFVGELTSFTYFGTNLVPGMEFQVSSCDLAADLGGSTTARSFSCIPRAAGMQTISIREFGGGAAAYTGSVSVGSPAAITVAGLAANQSAADQAISGSFIVTGSTVSMVRVHAGTSAATPSCYTDLTASTGAKSFSFNGSGWTNENGLSCASLIPGAGSAVIVFKVEARDVANNVANGGIPPTGNVTWKSASLPISVAGLATSQAEVGAPIVGSFTVNGPTVGMVRVHAGTNSTTPSCYQDLTLSTGAKTFSFSGSWTNENGLSCAALIPGSGSAAIVFKLEVRDAADNLANAGVPPTVTATWTAASVPIDMLLSEAGGWDLEMRLTAVPKAGGVGRFSFGRFACGGTLRYAGVLSATGEHVFQEDHEYGSCVKDCAIHIAADLRGYREVCPSPPYSGSASHTGTFSAHGHTATEMIATAQRAEGATQFGLTESFVNDAWLFPPLSGADFKAGVPALASGSWSIGLRMGLTNYDGIRVHFQLPTECRALEILFSTRDPGNAIYFRDMTMTTSPSYSSAPLSMPAGSYMLALRRLSGSTMGWTLHDTARTMLLESGTVPSAGLAPDILNGQIRLQGYRGSCAIQGVRVTDWFDATWF